MGISPKLQAESLFRQIGYGRNNAMPRPVNKTLDRELRELISEANAKGDVIINIGDGYYRPRPWIEIEKMEYDEYVKKDVSRAMKILRKKKRMQNSFRMMEVEHCGFKNEEKSGDCDAFIQLRLQL